MIALLYFIVAVLVSPFKSKSRLEAENAALKYQVIVLRRKARARIRLTNGDRFFFVHLYRWFPSVSFPKIPSGPDSHRKTESSHH
jgi:hypothetical protein